MPIEARYASSVAGRPRRSRVAGSTGNWSSSAGSRGFSSKRTMRCPASICMMPKAGASARLTGLVAMVTSASQAR